MSVSNNQSFGPSQAEGGKFVRIDPSTFTPSLSANFPYGQYAVLTYAVNPSTTNLELNTDTLVLNTDELEDLSKDSNFLLSSIDKKLGVNSEANPTTGFGELQVSFNRPIIQETAVYDKIPTTFESFSSITGTAGVETKMFKVSTGTGGVASYGAIQSKRSLNYKGGQGALARFTGVFPNGGVSLAWQGVGLINIGDELSFGYNGTNFGIWYRYGGLAEVRTLTITAAATGSETVTLTLNNVVYNSISITSGTVERNAWEVAKYINESVPGWNANQLGDIVVISATSDLIQNGTYSFSSTGTATGSIVQTTAAVGKTSLFYNQTSWNVDTVSWLDPTKGNVFEIIYQYLGFGNIFFYVEDPDTGKFALAHIIKYANNNTTPSLGNPSLRVGCYATSIGTTEDVVVNVGSFGAFRQGEEGQTRNPEGIINTNPNIDETPRTILGLRNRSTNNGFINQVEIEPKNLSISTDISRGVEFTIEVYENISDNVICNFEQYSQDNSIVDVTLDSLTLSGTASGGKVIAAFPVYAGNQNIDLTPFGIRLLPGQYLFILAKAPNGTGQGDSDATASLNWIEDF